MDEQKGNSGLQLVNVRSTVQVLSLCLKINNSLLSLFELAQYFRLGGRSILCKISEKVIIPNWSAVWTLTKLLNK